ncbi:hypothetical protein C5167_017798 [Papaver somniferum]|uniref:Uncharacterized protein n=1 Tax=Papaver somniferum TaxID=3469 RepID=A0A4Y7IPI4_PAPSO|nr:hypothetical protein C5167_017798 [Papaver somniferum]
MAISDNKGIEELKNAAFQLFVVWSVSSAPIYS